MSPNTALTSSEYFIETIGYFFRSGFENLATISDIDLFSTNQGEEFVQFKIGSGDSSSNICLGFEVELVHRGALLEILARLLDDEKLYHCQNEFFIKKAARTLEQWNSGSFSHLPESIGFFQALQSKNLDAAFLESTRLYQLYVGLYFARWSGLLDNHEISEESLEPYLPEESGADLALKRQFGDTILLNGESYPQITKAYSWFAFLYHLVLHSASMKFSFSMISKICEVDGRDYIDVSSDFDAEWSQSDWCANQLDPDFIRHASLVEILIRSICFIETRQSPPDIYLKSLDDIGYDVLCGPFVEAADIFDSLFSGRYEEFVKEAGRFCRIRVFSTYRHLSKLKL